MCIGIPGQITAVLANHAALIDIGGIKREINIALVPQVTVGQWVLVHVGFALSLIDEQEARDTLDALQSMNSVEPDVSILLYGEE